MTAKEFELPRLICSPGEAIQMISSGSVVMVGGFGLVGAPLTLIDALLRAAHVTDLTIISNNLGEAGRGLGKLLREGRVRHAIGSFFTSNPDVSEWHRDGKIDIELLPQGTLAEAIRAAGAGIGGFYTKTAVGTVLAEGHEERVIEGERFLFQQALHAHVALIKAKRADELGNLAYSRTARNFNPDMATAAQLVIAEVEEIVSVGQLTPPEIDTPHLYVDHLVQSVRRETLP